MMIDAIKDEAVDLSMNKSLGHILAVSLGSEPVIAPRLLKTILEITHIRRHKSLEPKQT